MPALSIDLGKRTVLGSCVDIVLYTGTGSTVVQKNETTIDIELFLLFLLALFVAATTYRVVPRQDE